jgi:hypothetical protein
VSWTVLRVVAEGVVLRDAHAARFACESPEVRAAFDRFCEESVPGIYALRATGAGLAAERRPGPWLVAGMPVRLRVSPFAQGAGPLAKAPPPSPWDAVRERGVCTLLTNSDGTELLEACTASLASWEDGRLVFAPADRPRVESSSEAVLRSVLPWVERPLAVESERPLVALNAVSGAVTLDLPGRAPVPSEVVEAVASVFRARTRR